MDNTKQNKPEQNHEIDQIIVSVLLGIILFPLFTSIFLARILMVCFLTWKSQYKKFKFQIIKLLLGVLFFSVAILIFFWKVPIQQNNIEIYDYFLGVTLPVKALLNLVETKTWFNLAGLLPQVLIHALITFIPVSGILFVTRKIYLKNLKDQISLYQEKLKEDDLINDPRKFNLLKHNFLLMLKINPHKLDELELSEREVITKKNNHIMLDHVFGVPIKHLKQHVSILGTTGSGKTETTFKFLKHLSCKTKPIIYVDGKGDVENILKLQEIANKQNKVFKLFTLSGEKIIWKNKEIQPLSFNPFSIRKKGIIVDSLLSLFDYSEEHYKAGAKVFIDILVETLLILKKDISWENIIFFLDKQKLIDLLKTRYGNIQNQNHHQNKDTISISQNVVFDKNNEKEWLIDKNQIESIDHNAIKGFRGRVGMFYNSTKKTLTPDGFSMQDVLKSNSIVIFSLNSLEFPEQASSIGKLIVTNIKSHAEINNQLDKKTIIALDEFNVFASENIVDILNKSRSKGYEVILSFQSISDLSKVSRDFRNQVMENTNAKIVHKTNETEGAEYLSRMLGTRKKAKKTSVAEKGELQGRESLRVVDEFNAHPNDLKSLRTGECFARFVDLDGQTITTPKIKVILD